MIAQVTTPALRRQFLDACGQALCFGCVLPVHLELFGGTGCCFAGERLALDVLDRTVWGAGQADPDELAAFLGFLEKRAYLTDGTAPAGWRVDHEAVIFTLRPGETVQQLPFPKGYALNEQPAPGPLADLLFSEVSGTDANERQDDFYSQFCTLRNHGLGRAWTLEQDGTPVCTVGAYAMHAGQAYLACGMTKKPLRGYGLGRALIAYAANTLAAEGWQVCFLARPERQPFYRRMGFAAAGALTCYAAPPEDAGDTGTESDG